MIATFIHLKWARSQWYFYVNSTIFALFLILYSLYISHLFARPEQFCQNSQVRLKFKIRIWYMYSARLNLQNGCPYL